MEKKQYIAPTITSVTFKIERGYALSNAYGPDQSFLGLLRLESDLADNYNDQGQQNWHVDNSYFGSGW